MFAAALRCNRAWGLVDAVMYLVRTVTDRGWSLTRVRPVQARHDAESERRLIERASSRDVAGLVATTEVEAMRGLIVASTSLPARPNLNQEDVLAALAVFLLVVASTFPVVRPFVLFQDVGTAKNLSRAIVVAMLFLGGLALGRYASYDKWKVGFMMAGLGAALVGTSKALGG